MKFESSIHAAQLKMMSKREKKMEYVKKGTKDKGNTGLLPSHTSAI